MPTKKSARSKTHSKVRRRSRRAKAEPGIVPSDRKSFPIVGVGSSAGGLAALTQLLKALPARSGLAFVLIQHLDPKHESALTQILSESTSMPVREVTEGVRVEADHVYVIPPAKSMTIRAGALKLAPRPRTPAPHHPIDEFFTALAEEQKAAAIGVVLSGTGSDGTLGLKAIKAEGGVTYAQDPKGAEWPAMPMSAISGGAADFVLPPRQIAGELVRMGRHPYLGQSQQAPSGDGMEKVYMSLRAAAGVDFRLYKQPTVGRRVSRRMALRKIDSLGKYAQFLKQNPSEAEALAEDIFIHVTGFFRDPDCFQAVRKGVLPALRSKRAPDDPIRIWVPGCSTGEEAYSLAMLLVEDLGAQLNRTRIQIFGTDVSDRAIEQARAGIYPEAAVRGISAARLKRFFVESDHGHQVNKALRDLCVFARHDLAKDPPFSKLDLISCRNVLIYMGPLLQKRVLGIFHYALKPGGALFLGKSEAISAYSDMFAVMDQSHKIFSRKPGPSMAPRFDWLGGGGQKERRPDVLKTALPLLPPDFQKEAEQVLLQRYLPPALVVDADFRILHFQGDTGPYLAPSTGPPTFHLLKMVRPEFIAEVRTTIAKAKRQGVTASTEVISFKYDGRSRGARLDVSPLRRLNGQKQNFLIVFQPVEGGPPRLETGAKGQKADETSRLERELEAMREQIRSLVAEHEASEEEMKAASEETLSSNEELQSTNEELETAKEELQSSNEELITLNEELRHRNADLGVLTNDLNNLLVGVQIPVLVLDGSFQIRRFTPLAGKLLNLIETDVGRPFADISSILSEQDWTAWFAEVTDRVRPVEREVKDRNGYWYAVRIRPYRTSDNKIDGVIVVLLDIDLIKRPLLEEARASRDYASVLLESSGQAVIVLSADEKIVLINNGVEKMFGYRRDEIIGQSMGRLLPASVHPRLSQHLREVFAAPEKTAASLELELDALRKDGSQFPVEVRWSLVERLEQKLAVAFVTDISERRRLEKLSEVYRGEIGVLAAQLITAQEEERRRFSRELHDGLCQSLASLALDAEGLAAELSPPAVRTRLRTLRAGVIRASEEARHIAYALHPSVLDDLGLLVSLKALCSEYSTAEKIPVKFAGQKLPAAIPQGVASGLYRIAQESLQNIAKHAQASHVTVELAVRNQTIRVSIKDDGVGFDPLAVRGRGGLGMVSMAERARMMGAKLSVESKPGQGAEIAIVVPTKP